MPWQTDMASTDATCKSEALLYIYPLLMALCLVCITDREIRRPAPWLRTRHLAFFTHTAHSRIQRLRTCPRRRRRDDRPVLDRVFILVLPVQRSRNHLRGLRHLCRQTVWRERRPCDETARVCVDAGVVHVFDSFVCRLGDGGRAGQSSGVS